MAIRDITRGPDHLGGAGFLLLSAYAGAGQILHFLCLWQNPHLVEGNMLHIMFACLQQQSGVSFNIMAHHVFHMSRHIGSLQFVIS